MNPAMKIKICEANRTKLNKILRAIQAKSRVKLVNTDFLFEQANAGEKAIETARKLISRVASLPLHEFYGSQYYFCEGDANTSSPGSCRAITSITLERQRGGWFLVHAVRKNQYSSGVRQGQIKLLYPTSYPDLRLKAWLLESPRYLDEWLMRRGGVDMAPSMPELFGLGPSFKVSPDQLSSLRCDAVERLTPTAIAAGVRADPYLIEYVAKPDEALQRMAIRYDTELIWKIKQPTEWVMWESNVLTNGSDGILAHAYLYKQDYPEYFPAFERVCTLAPHLSDLERLEMTYTLVTQKAPLPDASTPLPDDVLDSLQAGLLL